MGRSLNLGSCFRSAKKYGTPYKRDLETETEGDPYLENYPCRTPCSTLTDTLIDPPLRSPEKGP